MAVRRGPVRAGEKVQLTDRKGKMLTLLLERGAVTQTDRGFLAHDRLIGLSEGSLVSTISAQELKACGNSDPAGEAGNDPRKPWKSARAVGGWVYTMMRPRLSDFLLSMPRGAQIMYPKDIAQVLLAGDIRSGMRVLESGAGSGAMSIALLDAVGSQGGLTTIELRAEFARVAVGNATVYFGGKPDCWDLRVGDFDQVAPLLPAGAYDRIVLDMLDPWNRLDAAWRALAPGGVLTAYVTTATQLGRLSEALRASGSWTEPEISETLERGWKADGLAVRPQHQMIGHSGFLVVTRAMAAGFQALHKRERGNKNVHADIDQTIPEQPNIQASAGAGADGGWSDLSLRDISDRKLRKVLRDLERQEAQVEAAARRQEEP